MVARWNTGETQRSVSAPLVPDYIVLKKIRIHEINQFLQLVKKSGIFRPLQSIQNPGVIFRIFNYIKKLIYFLTG
jgi:hypothetical protein